MGGLGGHMNHVYDNLNLSFSGLLDIYTQAAAGNLNPTEKVDGQNIFFTYNLRDNVAKFARKSSEAASGGITREALNAEFIRKRDASSDPEGYQAVVDAFNYGMTAIEQALNNTPQNVLYTLFERAKEADLNDKTPHDVPTVFINCEVMYSKKRNMIMYDGDFIVFHTFKLFNENLDMLSEDELTKIDATMRQKFAAVVKEVEKSEQSVADTQWRVVGPQSRELNILGEEFLEEVREKIENILQQHGMNLNNTHADFVAKGVADHIAQSPFTVAINEDVAELLQRAVINPEEFAKSPGTLGSLSLPADTPGKSKSAARKKIITNYIGGNRNDAALLSNYLSKTKSFRLVAAVLEPFAQITPGLTAQLMSGVPSAFMEDSEKGTKIFRRTVELAIQYLENMFRGADLTDPKIASLKNRYDKQMKRLQSVDNITTAMEGVVFEYPPMSRQYYKFTGGFAAANQILGLLGWEVKEDLTNQAFNEFNSNSSGTRISEQRIRKMVRESITRTYLSMLPRNR